MIRRIFSRTNNKNDSADHTEQWAKQKAENALDATMAESHGMSVSEWRSVKDRYWELANKSYPDLDHHFKLHQRVLDAYVAKDPSTWGETKQRCLEHIEFSGRGAAAYLESENDLAERSSYDRTTKPYEPRPLPMHTGYERMCIILDKEGDYAGVIEFANRAKADGWNGTWNRRIERAKKNLAKLQQTNTSAVGGLPEERTMRRRSRKSLGRSR